MPPIEASLSTADKTLRMYPGMYHELFHEPERAQVQEDLIAWLDARTSAHTEKEAAPCPAMAIV